MRKELKQCNGHEMGWIGGIKLLKGGENLLCKDLKLMKRGLEK